MELNEKAKQIEEFIINTYGYKFEDLKIKSRKQQYVQARYVAIYLLQEYTNYQYGSIAALFNKKRCSIYTAIDVINDRIDTEKNFKELINEIKKQLA